MEKHLRVKCVVNHLNDIQHWWDIVGQFMRAARETSIVDFVVCGKQKTRIQCTAMNAFNVHVHNFSFVDTDFYHRRNAMAMNN